MSCNDCVVFRVQASNALGTAPLGPPFWFEPLSPPSAPRNLTVGSAIDPSSGFDIIWVEFLDPLYTGGMGECHSWRMAAGPCGPPYWHVQPW